jgi:hypothetical protein
LWLELRAYDVASSEYMQVAMWQGGLLLLLHCFLVISD